MQRLVHRFFVNAFGCDAAQSDYVVQRNQTQLPPAPTSENAREWWAGEKPDGMLMALCLLDRVEQLLDAGKVPPYLTEHVHEIRQFQMDRGTWALSHQRDPSYWIHAIELAVSRHTDDADFAWLMSVPKSLETGQAPLDQEGAAQAKAEDWPRPDTSDHVEMEGDARGSLSRYDMINEFNSRLQLLQSTGALTRRQAQLASATATDYRGEDAEVLNYAVENSLVYSFALDERNWLMSGPENLITGKPTLTRAEVFLPEVPTPSVEYFSTQDWQATAQSATSQPNGLEGPGTGRRHVTAPETHTFKDLDERVDLGAKRAVTYTTSVSLRSGTGQAHTAAAQM